MPPDLQKALGLLFFMVAILLVGMLLFNEYGCSPYATPAAYSAELAACNQTSKTLAESVDCENRVRAAFGRPLRDAGAEQ